MEGDVKQATQWKNGTRVVYPASFDTYDLARLRTFLSDEGSVPMCEASTEQRKVIVRHDVDHDLDHAVEFARWEEINGIRSTYFILHTAQYWQSEATMGFPRCRLIRDLGHEIGIHNDAMSVSADVIGADMVFQEAINLMKGRGALNIVGCADHGGAVPSSVLWENKTPADFGLTYEAYQLQRRLNCNYISDNRGKLNREFGIDSVKPTVLLVHPEHWQLP